MCRLVLPVCRADLGSVEHILLTVAEDVASPSCVCACARWFGMDGVEVLPLVRQSREPRASGTDRGAAGATAPGTHGGTVRIRRGTAAVLVLPRPCGGGLARMLGVCGGWGAQCAQYQQEGILKWPEVSVRSRAVL